MSEIDLSRILEMRQAVRQQIDAAYKLDINDAVRRTEELSKSHSVVACCGSLRPGEIIGELAHHVQAIFAGSLVVGPLTLSASEIKGRNTVALWKERAKQEDDTMTEDI